VPEEVDIEAEGLGQAQFHVLIVEDDPDCLAEYQELAERLGYPCLAARDGESALRMISEDRRIGLVVIDIRMPGMDGLTLLDELSERFMPIRPLVAVVVTGQTSIEDAVLAMRSNAVDYLEKPVSLKGLSSALRRAATKWARLAAQHQLLMVASRLPKAPIDEGVELRMPSDEPSKEDLVGFASALLKARHTRSKYFDPQILSGPAWGILMDLTAAGLRGERVPTSSACVSAEIPFSTALRHVNQLVAVTQYLASSWKSLSTNRI